MIDQDASASRSTGQITSWPSTLGISGGERALGREGRALVDEVSGRHLESRTAIRTLIIDNYDSFTFNLYQLVAKVCGEAPIVVRNDQVTWSEIEQLDPDNIVLSPGPGRPERPNDFGVCKDALLRARVPVLGVCLGHQGLGYYMGGRVIHGPEPMHGRLSSIFHDGAGLFEGIPQGFEAVRYHSLVLAEPVPDDLEVIARSSDQVVMGVRHRSRPLWGVQFHPESICTAYGERIVENFNALTRRVRATGRWGVSKRAISVVPAGLERAPVDCPLELRVRRLDGEFDAEAAFASLFESNPMVFWLDSSTVSPGLSRFSFMGSASGPLAMEISYCVKTRSLRVVRQGKTRVLNTDLFTFLRDELARTRVRAAQLPFDFNCGFVGYLGYELKEDCGAVKGPRSPLPDAQLLFVDRMIAFDHEQGAAYVLALAAPGGTEEADRWLDDTEQRLRALSRLEPVARQAGSVAFRLSRGKATYLDNLKECLRHIKEGETYEVCLTNKVIARTSVDPFHFYRTLRRVNPAPYSAFLRLHDLCIACSSPERFLRVDRSGVVESKPIKGTCRRGGTPEEDRVLEESLRTGEKDRSENLMIVDLLRNDLGFVAAAGSVHVPKLMHVESYATVHQLVSTVRAQLRPEMSAVDCVRASFPGGSMTGAPKVRTMQIIDQLEVEPRGIYSGAIGYLSLCGAADLNIVIRTAVFHDGRAEIGVGGAVVALSDVQEEFDEMLLKSQALMTGLLTVASREEPLAEVARIHASWNVLQS
jgi:para-aminobenzoate synthetase